MFKNIWKKLSSGQKITAIGSVLLIISLFLNWFSDKDVFRSGNSYTALNGPLYLPGFTMLLIAVFVLGTVLFFAFRNKMMKDLNISTYGKFQMFCGFFSMYLLIVINSAYFHPFFGLNILEKKTGIGVLLALTATVLICVGGYLSFRKKFEQETKFSTSTSTTTQDSLPISATVDSDASTGTSNIRPTTSPASSFTPVTSNAFRTNPIPSVAAPMQPSTSDVNTSPETTRQHTALRHSGSNANTSNFSLSNTRGKTEYERARLYENLKRTMLRDTLTPEQRRKLREKEVKENVFSANFGRNTEISAGSNKLTSSSPSFTNDKKAPVATETTKKPQMYRMDL